MQTQEIERLYQRHASAIEAHCSHLLGHSADAPDAVHETFVRAMTRREPPESDDHMVRSLFRISTHVCIDVLRQRGVRRRADRELVVYAEPVPAPHGAYHARESVERVLSRCDDITRAIIRLRFVDGMRRVEIADRLGTTRRTVWNRLRKLQQLASELSMEG